MAQSMWSQANRLLSSWTASTYSCQAIAVPTQYSSDELGRREGEYFLYVCSSTDIKGIKKQYIGMLHL